MLINDGLTKFNVTHELDKSHKRFHPPSTAFYFQTTC